MDSRDIITTASSWQYGWPMGTYSPLFNWRVQGRKWTLCLNKTGKVDTWFNGVIEKSTSWKPTKMFGKAIPRGLPITTPSNCLYIWLLKLNSTPCVAISINSMKLSSGNRGQSRSPGYKASAKNPIVSSIGTLVSGLLMSTEQRNVLADSWLQSWIKLPNVKESLTQCEE